MENEFSRAKISKKTHTREKLQVFLTIAPARYKENAGIGH
jgi:hypothetical protein